MLIISTILSALFPTEATSDIFAATAGITREGDQISTKMISASFLAVNCTNIAAVNTNGSSHQCLITAHRMARQSSVHHQLAIIQITNKFAGGKQLLDDEVILIIRTI